MQRARALIAITSAALLISGLGTTTAHAAPVTDLYVNSGSTACNQAGPGTQAVPFCSIQEAADAVDPGQTVHVLASERTTTPIVISRSGTSGAPITFTGRLSATTDAQISPNGAVAAPPALVVVKDAQYVSLDHLTVRHNADAGLAVIGSQHVSIDRLDITRNLGNPVVDGLDIDGGSSDVTVSDSNIRLSSGNAIAVQAGASHIVIASAELSSTGTAVHADATKDLEIVGVSVISNGGGVAVTGAGSGSVENTVVLPATAAAVTQPAISVSAEAAGAVTADYNAVAPDQSGAEYSWGGTDYASSAQFRTATGQGQHDLDGLSSSAGTLYEGSPLIDSGNAGAPGESTTDSMGQPRVDDPTVLNTGIGAGGSPGFTDRGATEFQDPLSLSANTVVDTAPLVPGALRTYPFTVTITPKVYSPWAGVTLTYYFGDVSDQVSTRSEAPQQHTYTGPGFQIGYFQIAVVATEDTGHSVTTHQVVDGVDPTALNPGLALLGNHAMLPADGDFRVTPTGPYKVTSLTMNFGDGSAPEAFDPSSQEIIHVYPSPGSYIATAAVTDSSGNSALSAVRVTSGTAYQPVQPTRLLDTRTGTGAAKRKVGPGGVVRLKIGGNPLLRSLNPSAVVLNVTDANASSGSYVTVYPDGSARPNASNLNFQAGQTSPNLVTVPVGSDGYVDLYNASGTVDLIADIQGFFTNSYDNEGLQGFLQVNAPTRVLDTRAGLGAPKTPAGPGSTTTLTLPSSLVTDGTKAVVLSLTATRSSAAGFVTAYPGDASRPGTSVLNLTPGRTTSNLVVVPVDHSHQVKLYNSSGSTALIADVEGTYTDYTNTNPGYVPMQPVRLVDTRNGTGAAQSPVAADSSLRIKVTGSNGVPPGATAVILNLTGTDSSAATYLTAYGDGTRPATSNLNLAPGQTRPVQAVVPVDSSGYITVYNAAGTVDVIADLEGYFAFR